MNHLKKEVKVNYRISELEDILEMHHGKKLSFLLDKTTCLRVQ